MCSQYTEDLFILGYAIIVLFMSVRCSAIWLLCFCLRITYINIEILPLILGPNRKYLQAETGSNCMMMSRTSGNKHFGQSASGNFLRIEVTTGNYTSSGSVHELLPMCVVTIRLAHTVISLSNLQSSRRWILQGNSVKWFTCLRHRLCYICSFICGKEFVLSAITEVLRCAG